MFGLIVIIVFCLWVTACFSLAYAIGMLAFNSKPAVLATAILGAPVLIALPVVDEILGTSQFHRICEKRVFDITREKLEGRVVRYETPAHDEPLRDTLLPILYTQVILRDVSTKKVLGSFDRYIAKGGWLIQTLKISEAQSPLLVGNPVCQPPMSLGALANKYGFTVVR